MKLPALIRTLLLLVFVVPVFFSACIKDNCSKEYTYTYYSPVYRTKDEVRANIKSNPARDVRQPGKLYVIGQYIFLNDVDRGIHIIDNSNPSFPRNTAFIDIPGNLDIAVKGNTLYADMYTDLVTLDISNPSAIAVKKIIDNIFPHRYYGGGFTINNNDSKIIAEWQRHDTTITSSCTNERFITFGNDVFFSASAATGGSASPVGRGGSMARFAIGNNRLYTVSTSNLDVYNISSPADPQLTSRTGVGTNIETIYPFKDKLFIGSATGMFIYNVTNPDAPVKTGSFAHVLSCDPVIADDEHAFLTLRNGTACRMGVNQLDVLKLNNLTNPTLVKSYPMKNPHGLSKDGQYLFICDGAEGLKIFDASDVRNLKLVKQVGNIETYDVITGNHHAIVVAKDGLYQYNYDNINHIRLLSKISTNNN